MTTNGAFAVFIVCIILNSLASSIAALGDLVFRTVSGTSSASSTDPLMRSAGRSRKPVPVLPYHHVRYVFCMASGINPRDGVRSASLV